MVNNYKKKKLLPLKCYHRERLTPLNALLPPTHNLFTNDFFNYILAYTTGTYSRWQAATKRTEWSRPTDRPLVSVDISATQTICTSRRAPPSRPRPRWLTAATGPADSFTNRRRCSRTSRIHSAGRTKRALARR